MNDVSLNVFDMNTSAISKLFILLLYIPNIVGVVSKEQIKLSL